MKPVHVEVPVWTIKTTELNADCRPLDRPFRRIVSVETRDGRSTCAGIGRVALESEMLRFRDEMQADRFCSYFAEVVAPNDTRLSGSTERPEADYNCHSFAEVVAGDGVVRTGRMAVGWVRRYLGRRKQELQLDKPLGLGKRGFIFSVDDEEGYDVVHSFVGLGEGSDECLNILCIGGPVALTRYSDMKHRYGFDDEEAEYSPRIITFREPAM